MNARLLIKNFSIIVCIVVIFSVTTYLWLLPSLISSKYLKSTVSTVLEKNIGKELTVKNPKLVTGLNSNIIFTVDYLSLKKDNKEILNFTNLDTKFSLQKVFRKRLIVDKILAENVYININELASLLPKDEKPKKNKKQALFIDIFNSLLGVKNCHIIYKNNDYNIDFKAKHLILDNKNKRKYLHLDIDFILEKNNNKILVSTNDLNKIYIDKNIIRIDKLPINIDKSTIIIDAWTKRDRSYSLNIFSKNFNAKDIYDIVSSNIVIQNGSEILKPINNVNGNVNLDITFSKKQKISGDLSVNKVSFDIKDLLSMPVTLTQGFVSLDEKNIKISDFKGLYNNKPENKITMNGNIEDYAKTCDTKIISDIFITDDFFKNYISKILNSPVNLVGDAGSRMVLKSKNGSLDIIWYFLLKEGEGFKLGEQSMVLKDYKTLFKLDMSLVKNILKINTLNYYITNELKRGMTPVLQMTGDFDLGKNIQPLQMELSIPRPLPSEFLNFLIGQKIFKKGEISGNMIVYSKGEGLYLKGNFALDKVLIPSQRLFIKSGTFEAKNNRVYINSNGKYKRSSYDLSGEILNEIKLPIIVKDVNLKVDNIDVEKLLLQNSEISPKQEQNNDIENIDDTNSDTPTFTKNLIIVEKCVLNLVKGVYKDIKFGNLIADLSLDKNGVLKLKSNKFDIAEGISTLKVNADLINQKYYLRLGIKDVNSDIIASSILSLPREISGKAMGLIELTSDSSLKMNGEIKFKILEGTIEKVGYIEYILKVASLFRNPLAMISPSTLGDLVNIPEGRFDEIYGELYLKDNIIERMMVKSTADKLAAFIIGRYDLNTNDACLRIYTKISDKGKGFSGFLRNISLNSIASKLSLSNRNEANYYEKEISNIPKLKDGEDNAQVFLTKIDGDIINYNFLSTLKRIK